MGIPQVIPRFGVGGIQNQGAGEGVLGFVELIALHIDIALEKMELADERFGWRMFSPIHVQRCRVAVVEAVDDGWQVTRRPLRLEPVLHRSWIHLIERRRPAVIDKFLATRCALPEVREVRYEVSCRAVDDTPLEPIRGSMSCDAKR